MRRTDLTRLCESCGENAKGKFFTKESVRTACTNCGKVVPRSEMRGDVCRKCANEMNRPPGIPASSDESVNEAMGVQDINRSQDDSIAKSLFSLVKYNNGLFKSDKQASYLFSKAQRSASQGLDVKEASRLVSGYDTRRHTSVKFVTRLDQFGRTNASKVRWSAWGFILDGYGVLAKVKYEVDHKPGSNDYGQPKNPKVEWTRPAGTKGSAFFDVTGEEKKKALEREKAAKKNAPVIAQIQSIPGWKSVSILSSFVDQLQAGRTLSPRQQQVVDKELRKAGIAGVGRDTESWEAAMRHVRRWVESTVLPEFVRIWEKDRKERGGSFSWASEENLERNAQYKREFEQRNSSWLKATVKKQLDLLFSGKYPDPVRINPIASGSLDFSFIMEWLARHKVYDKGVRGYFALTGFQTCIVEAAQATDKAKRGKRVTKDGTSAIHDVMNLAKKVGWSG